MKVTISGYALNGRVGYDGVYLLDNIPPPFFPLYSTCCWNYLFEASDYNPEGFVGIGFCPHITAGVWGWRVLFYRQGVLGQVWGYEYSGQDASGSFPYPPQNCRLFDGTTSNGYVFTIVGGNALVNLIY